MTVTWRSQYSDQISSGDIQAQWSANGTRILRYYLDLHHSGLAIHKHLSAPDLYSLQIKTDALIETWDRRYAASLLRTSAQNGKDSAEAATIEAAAKIAALSEILRSALATDQRIEWEALKDRTVHEVPPFTEPRPSRKALPRPEYQAPKITFLDLLLGGRRKKEAAAIANHNAAVSNWLAKEAHSESVLATEISRWESRKLAHQESQEAEKERLEARQADENDRIEEFAQRVRAGQRDAIVELTSMVLEKSYYHDLFEKSVDVDYDPDSRTLLVEYELPRPNDMPRVKLVRFKPSTGELVETFISEREQKSNYDSACYQIALRSLYELFQVDVDTNIQQISFSGFVSAIDPSTGRDIRPCTMSILVGRTEFQSIDLNRVDPKACFKSLKGVSASSLAALVSVAPVMEIDRSDRRFVEGRDVTGAMSDGANLAAMSWEDFEHLVRQLFEREFQERGGEVRITQASRDGGVDAVAFDPDPIRGGKTIIQAKRYTRPVGVAAVRDLYGTLLNEGASRGILVTTADYGPDAYKFASGKPITLLSGSNLLHMLRQQGIPARIDLAEARKLLGSLPSNQY